MTSGTSGKLHLLTPASAPSPLTLVSHADREDFFSHYFDYTSDTEVPAFFHRWSAITGIAAFLGRSVHIKHGHFLIYPNTYCMLVGSPGTRKSTGIKLMKMLLEGAGYQNFAASRTSKEKFLMDLAGLTDEDLDPRSRTQKYKSSTSDIAYDLDSINIFGESHDTSSDKEMLIAADEFNNFLGLGNHDFISLLGDLWDYDGLYKNRIKNGKSVSIFNPTVSILGGNTPTGFSLAFPTEILGQGFFSRLLLIYGEPNGKQITFPAAPDPLATEFLIQYLQRIKTNFTGELPLSSEARKLLTKIYKTWKGIEDVRFESYSQRRFTHLLKLCIVVTVANLGTEVTAGDVLYANTILSRTEHLMPKALGEFGKARHSDVVHKIVQLLESGDKLFTIPMIWAHVVQDLEKLTDLTDILRNLTMAGKIQSAAGGVHDSGFLAKRKVLVEVHNDVVDYGLLTQEELGKI